MKRQKLTLRQMFRMDWRLGVDSFAHRCHFPSILQDRICEWFERHLHISDWDDNEVTHDQEGMS